jgi:hypothetical protein
MEFGLSRWPGTGVSRASGVAGTGRSVHCEHAFGNAGTDRAQIDAGLRWQERAVLTPRGIALRPGIVGGEKPGIAEAVVHGGEECHARDDVVVGIVGMGPGDALSFANGLGCVCCCMPRKADFICSNMLQPQLPTRRAAPLWRNLDHGSAPHFLLPAQSSPLEGDDCRAASRWKCPALLQASLHNGFSISMSFRSRQCPPIRAQQRTALGASTSATIRSTRSMAFSKPNPKWPVR